MRRRDRVGREDLVADPSRGGRRRLVVPLQISFRSTAGSTAPGVIVGSGSATSSNLGEASSADCTRLERIRAVNRSGVRIKARTSHKGGSTTRGPEAAFP
jgi:hypothetical protein